MAKSNYKMRWYDHAISGIMMLLVALAVSFRWFSKMQEGRSFSEINTSKTGGIAYLVAQLEDSNWRFVLVAFFLFLTWSSFVKAYEGYKKR